MQGEDEFETALAVLAAALASRLETLDWQLRNLGPRDFAVFTREIADGFTDVVEMYTASIVIGSRQWPIPLDVRFGLGYEPMTALMPVVTLTAESILVDEPGGDDHEPDENLTGPGPDAVALSVEHLVALIRSHRWQATRSRASIDGLARIFADDELTPPDLAVRWQPLLAAVSGDHVRARELLNEYEHSGGGGDEDLGYARFARQLRRWLDAGGPPVPPAEQTLRELAPPPPEPARPSFTAARAATRSRQAAHDVARTASHRLLSRDQLIAVLEAEYTARGLHFAPSQLALDAQMIELERQPFGKVRRTLRGLRLLKSTGGDAIKLARHTTGPEPEWLRPPATATYLIRSAAQRWVAVHLTVEAALLARITTSAPRRRLGRLVLIDVWLDPDDGTGTLSVHIGDTIIGTLDTEPYPALRPHLAAAAFYDEYLRIPGRLTPATPDDDFAVEIEVPSPD